MAKPQIIDVCRLCGVLTKLSFEHIPPRSAYNQSTVLKLEIEQLLGKDLDNLKGKESQKGAGKYTLCERCNNITGIWYVPQFSLFVRQGMEILQETKVNSSIARRYIICPLNVLKQIVCMMCSLNSPGFTDDFPNIRSFVLNRRSREWDPKFRIYLNYNVSCRNRYAGGQGILAGTTTHILSELTFPPFTYVMTHDTPPPSQLLVDITFFADSLYNELREVWLDLPVVEHYTWYPADYRTREQVIREAQNNSSQ